MKYIKTTTLVMAILVLGFYSNNENEAEAKISLSNIFNKVKTGIQKANNVVTNIQNQQGGVANNQTFQNVAQGINNLNQKLSPNSNNGTVNAQELQTMYNEMEVLRQKAQMPGATIQDKVNYLNSYSNFKSYALQTQQNTNITLQQKVNEYNLAKTEYETINKLVETADAGYASSQTATQVSTTPTQGTMNTVPSL